MDLVPLLFLIVIVLVSGVIALVADALGRKLGKKRLWLKLPFLHLRPKHTAQTGVFLSGVVVSFLTILIVAVLSSDVRAWILEGRKAFLGLKVARAELDEAEEQRTILSKTNQGLQKNLSEGNRKLGEQKKTIGEQKKTLDEQKRKIDEGSQKIVDLQKQGFAATKRISELNGKLSSIETQYARVNQDYQKASTNLAKARTALAQVRTNLDQARADRKLALKDNKEIKDENLRLVNENRIQEKAVRELQAETERLGRERETLETARDQVQATLDDTIKALRESQDDLQSAQQQYDGLLARYKIDTKFITDAMLLSREAALTYGRGQEVARISVPAGATAEQAKAAVSELIQSARRQAASVGAKKTRQYDAADIVDHFDDTLGRRVSAEEIEASLVRQITGLKDPQVIVGTSSLNAFVGEPVSLEVSIFPNPLVYKQGQVVAETRVDGKKDQSEIFRQVEMLLAQRVTERAKQDKMIPLAGTEAGFGSVSRDEILNVMDRVRKADRKVTLRAIAEADTRAGDPLKLRFGIR